MGLLWLSSVLVLSSECSVKMDPSPRNISALQLALEGRGCWKNIAGGRGFCTRFSSGSYSQRGDRDRRAGPEGVSWELIIGEAELVVRF